MILNNDIERLSAENEKTYEGVLKRKEPLVETMETVAYNASTNMNKISVPRAIFILLLETSK